MKKFNLNKTLKVIDDYAFGKHYLNTEPIKVDKPFYNLYEICYIKPFLKYISKHPKFLDTKNIKMVVKEPSK